MRSRRPTAAVLLAVATLGVACAGTPDEPEATAAAGASLELGTVPASVKGNVVSLPVTVEGLEIVKADGDTSGKSGHFHVFIDKDPPAAGQTIPTGEGIVHTTENPVLLTGLKVGQHEITVVAGNGAHQRIAELDDQTQVTVEGPAVTAAAPATLEPGEDLTVTFQADGVDIVKADNDTSGKTGHFHVLVDPAAAPKPGETIGPAEENKIVHTTEETATIKGLAAGAHVVWVVLGDGAHKVIDPLAAARLNVTVP